MRRALRRLVPVLAVVTALSAPACADREAPTGLAPTAPESAAFSSTNSPDLSSLAVFNKKPSITIAWAKKWIGPEGGRLDFQGFAIVVPAGAVDRVTQFSIQLPVDPNAAERVVADFGPHNSRFLKPLTIEFPYVGTSIHGSSSPTIVWWNDGWVDMGASLTPDGTRLQTQTDHFSTFGTTDTEERGQTITASGG